MWLSGLPMEDCPTARTREEPEAGFRQWPRGVNPAHRTWVWGLKRKVSSPTTGDRADQWQHPSEPGSAGSSVVGKGCHDRGSLANGHASACQFERSPRSLASCFSFALRVCHGTIILRDGLKMDSASNFLSQITVRGNRGEEDRETGKTPNLRKG